MSSYQLIFGESINYSTLVFYFDLKLFKMEQKKHPLNELINQWKKYKFAFDDSQSKLINKTTDSIVFFFGRDHDFFREMTEIRFSFQEVIIHPLDSENDKYWQKWFKIKETMLIFLRKALESASN